MTDRVFAPGFTDRTPGPDQPLVEQCVDAFPDTGAVSDQGRPLVSPLHRARGIAQEASVAPATVYQAFGTKQAILAVALDANVAGDGEPVAVLDRDWVSDARRQRNPRRQLRLVVAGACRIAARTAALKEVMRDAAATEPAVRGWSAKITSVDD